MTRMSLRRACTHVALFGASFGIGVFAFAPTAQAYTYDGARAATYAQDWAANGQALRNTNYNRYSQDCTNFVSQALVAGGLPQDLSGSDVWYHYGDVDSRSWTVANDLPQYLLNSGRATKTALTMSAQYTPAGKGDFYLYELGNGGTADHVSLASGWGDFANYYDPLNSKNYRDITGGVGDYLSQHTQERDKAPWNWGWQVEKDFVKKSNMRTWLINVT